jgi:hypothetical protein
MLTLLRAVSLLRIFASLRLRGQFHATSRDEAVKEMRDKGTKNPALETNGVFQIFV